MEMYTFVGRRLHFIRSLTCKVTNTRPIQDLICYFQVVEGGVTRRIARAMEVLHASGPGSRMKVMRAAFHTTAGAGVPASSYTVHASRRVSLCLLYHVV